MFCDTCLFIRDQNSSEKSSWNLNKWVLASLVCVRPGGSCSEDHFDLTTFCFVSKEKHCPAKSCWQWINISPPLDQMFSFVILIARGKRSEKIFFLYGLKYIWMVECFMGGDYYSILSTAEVTSVLLHHTLVIILQKLDRFLRKATKRWNTWPLQKHWEKWACSV